MEIAHIQENRYISKGIWRLDLVTKVWTQPPATYGRESMLGDIAWIAVLIMVHALLQASTCGSKDKADE
jgi:hypothetical protein